MVESWRKDLFLSGIMAISKFCRQKRFKAEDDTDFALSEVIVLCFLWDFPEENTVKALSQHVALSKGLVSRSVEALRQKGLIEERVDVSDRRKVLLFLRPEASTYVRDFKKRQEEFDRHIFEGISSEDLECTVRTFHKMLENILVLDKGESCYEGKKDFS